MMNFFVRWLAFCTLLFVAGCAGNRIDPVPSSLVNLVSIPDIPDARFSGERAWSIIDRRLKDPVFLKGNTDGKIDYLLISGGGVDIAFGGGVLSGWSKSGKRPEKFDIVTGTSAGALLAPLVFLGKKYDPAIGAFVKKLPENRIYKRNISGLFRGYLNINKPLESVVYHIISDEIVSEIAKRYREEGALLLVGTTNIDSKKHVIWNIGAIANAPINTVRKRRLIAQVITASTSIPVLFNPRLINVAYNGKNYREMHVDGGVSENIFIKTANNMARGTHGKSNIYILVNDKLQLAYKPVSFSITDIGVTSLKTLMTYSLGKIVENIHLRSGSDQKIWIASLPMDFDDNRKTLFNINYRQKVFKKFEAEAMAGKVWNPLK